MGGSSSQRIAVVCAANQCRSVYANAIMSSRLGSHTEVMSFGIDAVDALPICTLVRDRITAAGLTAPPQLETGSVRARAAELESAALVLTFTARQRAAVARLAPSVRDRLFMLAEASRLAIAASATDSAERSLDARIRALQQLRPSLSVVQERRPRLFRRNRRSVELEIPDAHSRPLAEHEATLDIIETHAQTLAEYLVEAE